MIDQEPFKNLEGSKSEGRLAGKYRHAWVEESFDFEMGAAPAPEKRNYLGTSITAKKIKIFLGVIVICLVVIYSRIFYLQIVKGSAYRLLAEGNRLRLRPIIAERGIIFDRFKTPLVENVPSFSLAIVPQDLPPAKEARQKIISQISQISGVAGDYIQEILKRYGSYSLESLVIKENLDYDSALKLYINSANLPGVLIEKGTKRHYLSGEKIAVGAPFSLAHVLGYLGKLNEKELAELHTRGYLPSDYLGKSGLEKEYEGVLRGKYGRKKIEVDTWGREQNVLAEEAPAPGQNLVLSIDLEAQNKLEDLIKEMLRRTGKKKAAGLVLNPQTGAVLAMVSWPTFNNNDFSGGISAVKYKQYLVNPDQPLFNRAIGGVYPSGSTVKLVIAAAALEEKIITKATTVLSTGGLDVGGHFFKDWKAGGHGATNVTKAIAWSVNTFFYYVGGGYEKFVGLGVDRLTKYMRAFNLAKVTGIDLPGEAEGFLPSRDWKEETKKERWYVGDTYNLSIGQVDLLVTPLQVAVWTSAVANGGKIIRPRLADKIIDPVSKKETFILPEIKNQNMVSAGNMEIVKQGMRECVTAGSCGLMQTLPFLTGGKTGTAQWSSKNPDHAWFTSFAPYSNPQVVVTILVEEGKEGSTVAMPIARDFLAWWGKKYLGH